MPGREHDRGFQGVGNVLLLDLSADCTGMYVCVHSFNCILMICALSCVLYLNRNFYYSMLLFLLNYFDKSRQNSPIRRPFSNTIKFVYF